MRLSISCSVPLDLFINGEALLQAPVEARRRPLPPSLLRSSYSLQTTLELQLTRPTEWWSIIKDRVLEVLTVMTEEWTRCFTARHEGIGGMQFLMLTARVTEELLLTHSGKGFRRWNEGC